MPELRKLTNTELLKYLSQISYKQLGSNLSEKDLEYIQFTLDLLKKIIKKYRKPLFIRIKLKLKGLRNDFKKNI